MKNLLTAIIALLFVACAKPVHHLPILKTDKILDLSGSSIETKIRYLGCGGLLMTNGESQILTDPFFSNPSILRAGLGKIRSDRSLIDRHLPNVSNVKSILITHSHYDHLLDVPYIYLNKMDTSTTRIFGSETTKNIMSAVVSNTDQLIDIGTKVDQWIWLEKDKVRVMPIRAEHAPHFYGVHLYKGKIQSPLKKIPSKARKWKEGTVFTYLIDFIQEGKIGMRLFIQPSSCNPRAGFPPMSELKDRQVDVALLGSASYQYVHNYPNEIVKELNPKSIIVVHWEDFFRKYEKKQKGVRFTSLKKFVRNLKKDFPDIPFLIPEHGVTITVQ